MAKLAKAHAHQATAYRGRARKEAIVGEFSDKVNKSKGMVFTNYQGLTHKQLETLKKAVKKLEAEYVVTKNTLLKRALEQSHKSPIRQAPFDKAQGEQDKQVTSHNEKNENTTQDLGLITYNFDQPTATLFIYNDIVEPLRQLSKMIKELKLPLIKFGLLEGKPLSEADIMKLSILPSMPVLRAQLLGQMQAPIQGLHHALQWNLQSLVMTLNAIKDKKPTN